MKALLSAAFFPPVGYFSVLAKYPSFVDSKENYTKQTYRNRCRILTSNGTEDIRVPVVHGGSRAIVDVEVDYSTPWVRRFEYALDTAYYSSPFYEYYRDGIFALMDSMPRTLWELDWRSIGYCCSKIGIPMPGLASYEDEFTDLRNVIHPKKQTFVLCKPYYQVFSEKFGFTSDLSVIDLLCNEGPESICLL